MRNKFKLLSAALLLVSTAFAQTEVPMSMYVPLFESGVWYDSQNFEQWVPGQNPEENFFISRVRPRERFVNVNTQAYPEEDANGKKVLWWMPISNGDWTLNLPSYTMRNDIFSLWSYLDVHGGWNQPMLRSSGTFSDVCHKNGVRNTVLVFFDSSGYIDYTNPNANSVSKFFSILFKEVDGKFINAERLVKMFRYYGIGGWSINPESSMSQATAEKLQDFIVACHEEAEKLGWGDQWNVCWYDSMLNSGGVSFSMNTLYASNQNWFAYRLDKTKMVADHFFLNYNHGENQIKQAVRQATSLNQSSYDVYTGQHIGTRGLGDSWRAIMENPISIGTWGEHSQNNIFYNSTDKGSAPETLSQVYTEKLEMFFSGGNRNTKKAPDYISARGDLSYENMKNFNGVATKVVAQSTLSELPFVTYFSLGNGLNNSEKGEKFSEFQWYNLGMQDFMPTWRWWIVDNAGNVPADAINCDLSYEEAYMGANSLKVSGATAKSNIHLFKTKFAVTGNETLTLVYKLREGTDPKLKLTYSLEGSENTFHEITVPAAKEGEWTTATWTLSDQGIGSGDVIACLGASVENTDSKYAVYIGQLSIVDPAKTYNPVKPEIVTTGYEYQMNHSAYNYETIKLIWKAKDSTDPWVSVYNDEVDTWYYEVMFREDGGEPKLANRTTSWAAVTAVPLSATAKTFQVGVRAVAPDGETRSEIAWLDETFEHKYEYKTGIVFDGRKIVPNEEFTITLEDPTIPTAHWKLMDENGVVVSECDGQEITASCENVGLYSLYVSFLNPTPEDPSAVYENTYDGLIVITPEATGRYPKADFTFDEDIDISDGAKNVTFTFNGVKGEGYTSNAVELTDGTHFFATDPAVLGKPDVLTMAAWVKPMNLAGQVMSLRDLGTNPSWGSTWIYLEREKVSNQVQFCLMGRDRGADFKDMFSGVEVRVGSWYHIAMVLDRPNREVRLYVNGKRTNTQSVSFKTSYDLYSLGTEGFQGAIDEVQFWNKALTDEEMKVAMYGYTGGKEIPAGLQGYWIFEDLVSESSKKYPNLGHAGEAYPGGIFKGTSMSDRDNVTPSIVSGSTWLSGSTKVEATLTWDFKGASQVDLSNPEAPVVTYDKAGEYPAKLTVTNAYGTDVKEILVKVKDGGSSVDDVLKPSVVISPTVFTDHVTIALADEGLYSVNVYDLNGLLVKTLRKNCAENETIHMDLQVAPGMYLMKVLRNGLTLESAKIIKK